MQNYFCENEKPKEFKKLAKWRKFAETGHPVSKEHLCPHPSQKGFFTSTCKWYILCCSSPFSIHYLSKKLGNVEKYFFNYVD
jgi:hypothetical protein